jgi:hypothetical protein
MAEEDFKRGLMIWRQDTAKIYVLYNDGRWERYDDIWQEGDPEFTCGMPSSPPTPKRGFGKIWCTYTNVQQDLGAATTAEEGDYGLVQSFYGGSALRTGGGWVYVLLDDGTWR